MDGFRHVNNAVYLTYLEAARDAFVAARAPEAVDSFVVRRVEIDYLAPLGQDDGEALVSCDLEGVGTSSVRLRETIRAASTAASSPRPVRSSCTSTRRARAPARSRPRCGGSSRRSRATSMRWGG